MAARQANGPTVSDLAAVYLREVVAVRLKPALAKSYRYTIEKHILPVLGRKPRCRWTMRRCRRSIIR